MKTTRLLSVGAILLAVGCGTKIKVDVDLNGTTGDELVDAFFAQASIEDQIFFDSEDFDGDGNLDVNEDLDFDFNLDVDEDLNDNGVLDADEVDVDGDGNLDLANEDIDGDGQLDFIDEDANGNGEIDVEQADLNDDGVIDGKDIATLSALFVIASSGEVSCDVAAAAIQNQEDLPLEGTVLNTIAIQTTIGGGPSAFVDGAVIEAVEDDLNEVFVFSTFGKFENGNTVVSATSDFNDTLTIRKLNDTLSFDLVSTLFDDNNDNEVPLNATLKNVVECEALSAELQKVVEAGEL